MLTARCARIARRLAFTLEPGFYLDTPSIRGTIQAPVRDLAAHRSLDSARKGPLIFSPSDAPQGPGGLFYAPNTPSVGLSYLDTCARLCYTPHMAESSQPPTADETLVRDEDGNVIRRICTKVERSSGRPVDGYTIIVSVVTNDSGDYGTREVAVGPGAFDQPHEIERKTISLLRAAREDLDPTE